YYLGIEEAPTHHIIRQRTMDLVDDRVGSSKQVVCPIDHEKRVGCEHRERRILDGLRDAERTFRICNRVAGSIACVKRTRSRDQRQSFVLRTPSNLTLLDTVGCRGDCLVKSAPCQRELRLVLGQTELPEPLVPVGGARGALGNLLQKTFGPTRVMAPREREQRVDSCADDGRKEADPASQLGGFRLKCLCRFEIKDNQMDAGRHRRGTREHWYRAVF